MDAGMPSVVQLTTGLRERLPGLKDINGDTRPEFPMLFDAIAHHDGEVTKNYERFFEWLALLCQGQRDPFHKAVRCGLTIIDVNPSGLETGFERYKMVSLSAREAFESGAILEAVRSVGS